jgi:hypothetical protein
MIACSVCGAANEDFATVCASCRSFLQGKVDTLDLFASLWGLLAAPVPTFRRIVLARHKNYVLLLSALFGSAVAFNVLWLGNLGPRFEGLGGILVFGLLVGACAGPPAIVLASVVLRAAGRLFDGRGTFRALFAVMAYGVSPLALSLVITLPLEAGVFGAYFFDHNPPPFVINPVPYVIVSVLHGVSALASLVLATIGVRVAHGVSAGRAAMLILLLCVITGGVAYALRTL